MNKEQQKFIDDSVSKTMEHNTKNMSQLSEKMENKVSKRPWRLGGTEVLARTPDGKETKVWVSSIMDANGNIVCYGSTEDMKYILSLEETEYNLNKD